MGTLKQGYGFSSEQLKQMGEAALDSQHVYRGLTEKQIAGMSDDSDDTDFDDDDGDGDGDEGDVRERLARAKVCAEAEATHDPESQKSQKRAVIADHCSQDCGMCRIEAERENLCSIDMEYTPPNPCNSREYLELSREVRDARAERDRLKLELFDREQWAKGIVESATALRDALQMLVTRGFRNSEDALKQANDALDKAKAVGL